jgi:hypothetical protein
MSLASITLSFLQRAADVMGHRLVIGFEPAHKTRCSRNGMTVAA